MSFNVEQNVRQRYNKVPSDGDDRGRKTARTANQVWEERREKLTKVLVYIKDKVEAFLWVAAAAYGIYYTNFFRVIFNHPNINSFFLNLSLMCVGLNVCLALYVSIVLPYILGIKESFETYAPKVTYIGAFSGFVGFLTMLIAIWPVWGWWSPIILFVMFMGYMMSAQFLPNHSIGSFIYALIFVLACFSYKFIDHEGLAHDPIKPDGNMMNA